MAGNPADLANIREEGQDAVGAAQQQQRSSNGAPPRGTRRGFTGTAAFQSAMARKQGEAAQQQPTAVQRHGHTRRISLQRGAGASAVSEAGMNSFDHEDAFSTDDGASIASFNTDAAFDPTRRLRQEDTQGAHHANRQQHHLRIGSEFPAAQGGRQQQSAGAHGRTVSLGQHQLNMSFGAYVTPQQAVLQQQIDLLQLRQKQLQQQQQQQQQQMMQNAVMPQPTFGGRAGNIHRRVQSYAPQAMQGASSYHMGGMQMPSEQGFAQPGGFAFNHQPPANGHGRRHSVNVTNRQQQQQQNPPQQDQHPISSSHPTDEVVNNPAAVAGVRVQQLGAPFSMAPFAQASLQLQTLSPEYLMAGGGLLNVGTLGVAGMNDLADGFTGNSGPPRRGTHGRTNSTTMRINGVPGQNVVDLAQAQAQLASLHQSRAQISGAPGGHNRITSFGGGFDPALIGLGNSGSPAGALQRKALFGSYLPQSSLPPLLAAGKLVVGVLRVNKRNRSDAYVSTEVLDSDIFISGSKDRNRALEGDVVAVELLDPNEVWSIKREKEDKKKRKEEQGNVTRRPDTKTQDDVEVEGAQLRLVEDEEDNEQSPPALAGHVVAIVERAPGQLFSGILGLLRPSSAATKEKQQAERAARGQIDTSFAQPSQRPRIVWFRPTDKRVPLIAIPADQAPADFWSEGGQDAYSSRLFVACIKRWPITSLHPFGALVEEVGAIGNVEAETQALLKDSLSTATEEFSEAGLKCLPPLPWSVPAREFETRRDFRDVRVFSIDPPTAKDLDDALSVKQLEDSLIEVGVHIADVSYFVKIGSALDRDARKRGTSVYLVQRAVPMLPPTLCEELCSLVPNVERLAFSAVFKMTQEGHVVDSWYGRTVIKSCAKLAYSDAQAVIEGGKISEEKVAKDLVPAVTEDIKVLHGLAAQMRKRRFDRGALHMENVKLAFTLDENGLPSDAYAYKTYQAHQLVEEFMLLANMSVGSRIAAGLPETALLRRHEKPMLRRLDGFVEIAKKLGYDMDITSSGALYRSMEKVKEPNHRQALETLASRAMPRAKYFCTGMVDIAKYEHYALNVPLYTHFTSPIRRYADLMVHRQLEMVLQTSDKFPVDKESMAKIAQQCNVKRNAAKLAQEQSQHLFLCLLIHDLTMRYGPVVRNATVIGVLDSAFDVLIQEFGVEKRVHVDQMPVEHHSHDEASNTLTLYWRKGVDVLTWLAENSGDAHMQRLKEVTIQHTMMEMTSQSHTDEEALFDDDHQTNPSAAYAAMLSGEDAKGSEQRMKSFTKAPVNFNNAKTSSDGHCLQEIQEIDELPVILTADLTRSPPVIRVCAVNPFAN